MARGRKAHEEVLRGRCLHCMQVWAQKGDSANKVMKGLLADYTPGMHGM